MPSLYSNFLLVAAGQGFFLAMLLGLSGRRHRSARIPAALVFLCSLDVLQYSLAHADFSFREELYLLTYPLGFLYGPLLFLDTGIRTGARPRLLARDALHAGPYVFYILISAFYFETTGLDTPAYVEALRTLQLPWWMLALEFCLYPCMLIYVATSLTRLRAFRAGLHQSFSSTERLELSWLRNLHTLLAIACLSAAVAFLSFFIFDERRSEQAATLTYATIVGIIYLVGYFAVLYPALLTDSVEIETLAGSETDGADPVADAARYERTRLSAEQLEEYQIRIREFARDSRIYLEPGIKIDEFARRAGLPPHHISQTINRREGRNFYRFINEYRVSYAGEALRDPERSEQTILRIALDSGFNSKATFNAVFKEYTGVSPSAFRRGARTTRGDA